MRDVVVGSLLGIAVVCAWIGAAGLARLVSALDRLHAVVFVTLVAELKIMLAAFVADGRRDARSSPS